MSISSASLALALAALAAVFTTPAPRVGDDEAIHRKYEACARIANDGLDHEARALEAASRGDSDVYLRESHTVAAIARRLHLCTEQHRAMLGVDIRRPQ